MIRILISLLAIAGIGSVGANQYFKAQIPEVVEKRQPEEKVIMGYLSDIATTTGNASVKVDDAIWLLGEEAIDVAVQDKRCDGDTRETCLPNNFYIRNIDTSKITYQISDTADVFMQTYKPGGNAGVYLDHKISLEELSKLIADDTLHFNKVPYNLLLVDNIIVKITEIYLP